MQKEFEAANPDIKLKFTYVPFGELVSRTLQMAAVRKPPGISAIDNPDVLRVAKAGILKDISADVAKIKSGRISTRDRKPLSLTAAKFLACPSAATVLPSTTIKRC